MLGNQAQHSQRTLSCSFSPTLSHSLSPSFSFSVTHTHTHTQTVPLSHSPPSPSFSFSVTHTHKLSFSLTLSLLALLLSHTHTIFRVTGGEDHRQHTTLSKKLRTSLTCAYTNTKRDELREKKIPVLNLQCGQQIQIKIHIFK